MQYSTSELKRLVDKALQVYEIKLDKVLKEVEVGRE